RTRSWSVGVLFAVDRILYSPLVKSRGFGNSNSAAGPFPSPFSPWHPTHFRSYTAFPAFASCAHTGADVTTTAKKASAIEPKVRSTRHGGVRGEPKGPPDLLVRGMLARLPPSRLLSRRVVEIHDDLPDLLLGQPVFPRRHHRVPRRRFLREARTALGDAPEEESLLQHRDRARILKVGGRRIEARREVAFAVEVVAVPIDAVADVDLAAFRHVLAELRGILAQRILRARDVELLAAELDRGRRRRVHGAQLGRRLRLR